VLDILEYSNFSQGYFREIFLEKKRVVRKRKKHLSTKIKQLVWSVKSHRCEYCGQKLKFKNATVDHFVPRSRGGENSFWNWVLSCEWCNNRKGDLEFKSLAEAQTYLKGLKNGS